MDLSSKHEALFRHVLQTNSWPEVAWGKTQETIV